MRPPLSHPLQRKPRPPAVGDLVAEVLAFLAEDTERLDRFMALSGLDIGDLRRVAGTSAFAESLLDHLCQDESTLVTFATTKGYDPASIERVRQTLAPPPFES